MNKYVAIHETLQPVDSNLNVYPILQAHWGKGYDICNVSTKMTSEGLEVTYKGVHYSVRSSTDRPFRTDLIRNVQMIEEPEPNEPEHTLGELGD